jgi:hypothetical protein
MVSEVDTFLSVTDRSNGQTIRKDIADLNSAVVNYYMQLTFTDDIQQQQNPHTSSSSSRRTVTKSGHIQDHKRNLNRFARSESYNGHCQATVVLNQKSITEGQLENPQIFRD